jgi:hypothetical protein
MKKLICLSLVITSTGCGLYSEAPAVNRAESYLKDINRDYGNGWNYLGSRRRAEAESKPNYVRLAQHAYGLGFQVRQVGKSNVSFEDIEGMRIVHIETPVEVITLKQNPVNFTWITRWIYEKSIDEKTEDWFLIDEVWKDIELRP